MCVCVCQREFCVGRIQFFCYRIWISVLLISQKFYRFRRQQEFSDSENKLRGRFEFEIVLTLDSEIGVALILNSAIEIVLRLNSKIHIALRLNSEIDIVLNFKSEIEIVLRLKSEIEIALRLKSEIEIVLRLGCVIEIGLRLEKNESDLLLCVSLNDDSLNASKRYREKKVSNLHRTGQASHTKYRQKNKIWG